MTKTIDEMDLKELLPSSIRKDDRMGAAADAVQPWLVTIAEAGPDGQLYVDLDQLTSEQLDHLAWQFNADVWRDTWPMNIKRSTLRKIIEDKRLKGTRWAVEQAVQRLGSSIVVEEWWEVEPKGPPHTFTVTINVHEIPDVDQQELTRDIYRAIDLAKPVRSHYKVVIEAGIEGRIGVFGIARGLVYKKMHAVAVEPQVIDVYDPSGILQIVIDTEDVNNFRHWSQTGQEPATDNEIELLPAPTEGETIYAMRNVGAAGGWIRVYSRVLYKGGSAVVPSLGQVSFQIPWNYIDLVGLGYGETPTYGSGSSSRLELQGAVLGGGVNDYCNLELHLQQDGHFEMEGVVNEHGVLRNLDASMEIGEKSILLALARSSTHAIPPFTDSDPNIPPLEASSFIFKRGFPDEVPLLKRYFCGLTSDIPNYDWEVHGPALKKWLDGG